MSSARPRPTGASSAAPGTPRSTPMRQGSASRLSASANSATGNTTTTGGLKPATKIGGATPAKRVSLATTTPVASPARGGAAKTSSKTPSPVKGSKSPDRKGAAIRSTTDTAAATTTPSADAKTPEPAAGMGKPRLSLLRFNRDNSSTPQPQQQQPPPHQSPAFTPADASDFNNNDDHASGYFLSPTDADGEAPFASAFSGSYEPTSGGGNDDESGVPGAAGSFAASGDGSSPPPSAISGGGAGGGGSKGWAVMKDYYKSQKFQQRRPSAAAVPLQHSPSLIGAQSRSAFGTGGPNAQSNGSFSVALFGTKSQNYFGRGMQQSGASEGGSKEGGFPSPGQQGGFGEEDSHLRMILEETEAQLTEARSNAESAQFRVSFLEGEQSRLQHQAQTLRGDVKKLQADIFDLTSSKAHYSKQVDDLVEEKEELQLQLLGAGLVEKKAMQDMQVEMIDMQALVERTTATLVKKDQLISNLLNENEKLKRGKTEQRDADSKHGDVQVRLHIAEKGKAVLQDKYDKEAALVAVRDEEIYNLNAEIDHLNAAIERISKKTRRVGLGGAFAKALDIETPTNKKPAPSPTRNRGMSTLEGSMRGGASSPLGGTISGLNSTIALLDEVEHEGDDYDEAVGKYLRVIRIDRALEGFKVEREGLQALLTEGMASFQELFNAHRVMQAISYDDSKKATELMIKEEARLKAMGPAASPYSNTRRQTPSARRHASPSKSPRGHQQQPVHPDSVDTAEPPQSPTSSLVNISITSATARSNGATPHKAPTSASTSAPVFELEVSAPQSASNNKTLHAPASSPSKHLSPLQQRIARARSGSVSQLGNSALGASWNGAQSSSIRSTPNAPQSPQQLSLGGGTPTTTSMAPPPQATTTANTNTRGASPRGQDDHTAFLQHHHQGEGCVGAHRKCYVTSWYCATGKDMLESWLTSMNLYSPALVNLLYNAGFVDMQALSKMTEKDMSDLQIVHGIRRKLLSGVEGLRDKLRVVTDETLRMLRNSYYLSDDSYENHRNARSASVAHTDFEGTDDDNEEVVDEGRLRERRQRRHVQRVARARDHLIQLQKRFSTQQRQLSLLSGTGFIPAFSAINADGESEESLPAGQVSEVADPQEYHTKAVAAEAPMVLDVMLQEMQSWFADIRLAIEAQEGAVERILQSFDDEEGNPQGNEK